MTKLDIDEKEILDSFERGEWRSTGATKRERKRYGGYAEATFRKNRRVNIRLSQKDLEAIQKRALAEGLPYQTLISSLLHKYAAGRLVESSSVAPAATDTSQRGGSTKNDRRAPLVRRRSRAVD
jgi:predicted DNA binding CopG/RHH family protein